MKSPVSTAQIRTRIVALIAIAALLGGTSAMALEFVDVTTAAVGVEPADSESARFAATVLAEEVERRTGVRWTIDGDAAEGMSRIDIVLDTTDASLGDEGYRIGVDLIETWVSGPTRVRISASTRRALLFGVGRFLREADCTEGVVLFPTVGIIESHPAQRLRGHQLGYRPLPNSYDAWSVEQFDQYIRELVFFGTNAIESIPTSTEEGVRNSKHMIMTREEMNVQISGLCQKYDIEYWIFAPAMVDLSKRDLKRQLLRDHEAFYRSAPYITAVFVPGGDPGTNHPQHLYPYLAELSALLKRYHPNATLWTSLQKFEPDKAEWTYAYLNREQPDWLAGIVSAPWDPGIEELRANLPERYPIRVYPDITHNIRCQFPVPWWDPALNMTLGREAPNPRPYDHAIIHEAYTRGSIGFLAYSEGIHDDVNKTVWSLRGWDPDMPVVDVVREYSRFFFGPDVAERAADGILALEGNWRGPLATNGGVEATLALWRELERNHPELQQSWRWNVLLLRAYYDAYVRSRLIRESALEAEAMAALGTATEIGPDAAISEAERILAKATEEPIRTDLRQRIEEITHDLFRAIGYQTSVPKYGAHGPERGAILDFVDFPLNDRWWLEDQFAEIRQIDDRARQLRRVEQIRTWESPGEGSFYDDIGNVAKSPRVVRGEGLTTDPYMLRNANPFAMWWNEGSTRVRQSWISDIHWPIALRYTHLDPNAVYIVRMTGYGNIRLRMDGHLAEPRVYGRERTDVKEWVVPGELIGDGTLELTFDDPDVGNIHWRTWSRVNEVWLLKH